MGIESQRIKERVKIAVIVAAHAGFCFGVRRAVETAEQVAPAITLGPIIHNPQTVARLEKLGIRSADSVENIPAGARAVIRSHGVSRAAAEALTSRGCELIDATCPFVARIHAMAKEASENGRPLIVVGEADHPEVQGILGWTDGEKYAVLTEEDVERLPRMKEATIVSQTTMVESKFHELCAMIEQKIDAPDIRATICPATRDRQKACIDIAAKADVMIVIGGRTSSNSRKLYQLALQYCPRTYFVESASELDGVSIEPNSVIGITAGASTPDCIIQEVVAKMTDIEAAEF